MEVKTSFWGLFTREGRLKNLWARALADPDPASGLNRLRQVQQRLQKKPMAFAHLWWPFLDTFLDSSRVRTLTDDDLKTLVEMGSALSGLPGTSIRPEHVWFRVVQAHDTRGEERQARTLLTRIYNDRSTSVEGKQWGARDLARRGAAGDEHVNIYIDHLRRLPYYSGGEADIINVLRNLCTVDFDSDDVRLRRAREVAQRLIDNRIQLPGLQTPLGLHALLIEQNPNKAARHFNVMFQANPDDRVTLVGLLASQVRNEAYNDVVETGRNIRYGHPTDTLVSGLLLLNKTLQWLDSYVLTGPHTDVRWLEDIKRLNLNKYVGDVLDVAIGRLHLLTGNAQRAVELLVPLADKHPEQPRWGYYAAWASALIGDRDAVARRFVNLAKWPGRWTVACLLLDTDPALAEKNKVYTHLEEASKAPDTRVYAPIIEARVALARSSPPPEVNWSLGPRMIEGELEALRTVLGCALYKRDGPAVAWAVALPLFQRLPAADQYIWTGLQALLTGNRMQGRALLEEAAVHLGYRRAALVLAVHLLEQNKISEAKRFLERAATGRTDAKIVLLRAYIDACDGRTESAAGQLEKLASRREPRANYVLGNLYLQRAEEARRAGRLNDTRLYRDQAAGAFDAALKAEKRSFPTDCEALARCATFVASPTQGAVSHSGIWSAVEQLEASRRRPWLVWNAAIAHLWYGKPSEVATACEEMLTLLEENTPPLEDAARVTLIQAVARVCSKAEDIAKAEMLETLLGHLSARSELPTIKRLARLGTSAVALLRYTAIGKQRPDQALRQVARLARSDTGNGSLALLLAYASLDGHNQEQAVAALQEAQPENDFERCLSTSLAGLLEGHIPPLETLPQTQPNTAPELVQGSNLLRAAAAFASDKLDQGYEAVLVAMREEARDTSSIVNIARFLPALCAYSTRGRTVPPYLVEAVRKMSSAPLDGAQSATVARCAAAIGEIELACRLWEQTLINDGDPTSPLRREFTELLCYLAADARKAGNDMEAVRRLRQAANQLAGER